MSCCLCCKVPVAAENPIWRDFMFADEIMFSGFICVTLSHTRLALGPFRCAFHAPFHPQTSWEPVKNGPSYLERSDPSRLRSGFFPLTHLPEAQYFFTSDIHVVLQHQTSPALYFPSILLPPIRWGVVHWTDGRFPGEGLGDLQEHGESLHHEDGNGPEAASW